MSERTVDFSDYKVGDRVWDLWLREWKTISKRIDSTLYFGDATCCAVDGLHYTAARHPRYYPNSFEIPNSAFERPLPELEVDAKVWVRNASDYGEWLARHFSRWHEGFMYCWESGRTSHSQTTGDSKWHYYSLTDPTEAK